MFHKHMQETSRTAKIEIKLSQNVKIKTAVLFSICDKKINQSEKRTEMPDFYHKCHMP